MQYRDPSRPRSRGGTFGVFGFFTLLAFFGLLASPTGSGAQQSQAASQGRAGQEQMIQKLVEMAPYDGFLAAHRGVENPPELLGGPLRVEISQQGGGVYVALPAHRELDQDVFGSPELPRAFGGTPGVNGLPPAAREAENGRFTQARPLTPFGDRFLTLSGAQLDITLDDVTAFDGATSRDEVQFRARWEDQDGNSYEVRCCAQVATHGVEYPTFGGVVTNHLMHGSTRVGSALMPTEYVYAAFWGMGQVRKNGEVLQSPRLVHGMLTEYVRTAGYELAEDEDVTPTARHFHLMVPPFMPDMDAGRFREDPVQTGFSLQNGQPLPFWHVMFESVEVNAERGR